ncbi:MAG: ABC transporter ATP-binding protein [Coriobacteriia bacterium]|nr:ABC transporter ATP-binding protein [Coriobacteriia bacterium]
MNKHTQHPHHDVSAAAGDTASSAIIETSDLTKTYVRGTAKKKVENHALRGVTMSIPRGSFSCIVGPSGHGKSTLMHLIGGLDRASSGTVTIDGINYAELSDNELSELRANKIGFVFQFFNLLQNLTAVENIETAMLFAGKGTHSPAAALSAKEQRVRALELLELVGLGEKADAKPGELSGGQQQRVAIARALANDPEILLMDEPTGNLDSASEAEVLDQLMAIHKAGKTIVIVTHNAEVSDKAQYLFEIRDGKLAQAPA